MATVPDQASTGSSEDTDFGANDWLLEEMYEQYTADPSSVDDSWVSYFKTHGAPGAGDSGGAGTARRQPRVADRETVTATARPPRRSPRGEEAGSGRGAGVQVRDLLGTGTGTHPGAREGRPPPSAPAATRRTPTVEKPTQSAESRPATPGAGGGVPADPPNPSHRPNVNVEEPERTVLRGAPARTAKNMDISLTVPTATSVRSLPVKLLIDQRVVINNHLRRARGGKVSYTHLIGYAMVQALKSVPAMNNGYDDGRRQADHGGPAST